MASYASNAFLRRSVNSSSSHDHASSLAREQPCTTIRHAHLATFLCDSPKYQYGFC